MPAYRSDRWFQFVNSAILFLFSLTMVAPLVHLAAVSLSSSAYVSSNRVYFWPKGFQLEVYATIFGMSSLWRSLGVTIYITVLGTLIALLFTTTLAYALSRPVMPGRKLVLKGIVVTFIFSAPMIPTFLVVNALGLVNTLWALMIPGALGAFNVIIMKTFFQGISSEMFDAAKIDGNSEFGIYARITIPLSTPVIATIALFHAVHQWNSYFSALIYIRNRNLMPLQVLLRNLIVGENVDPQTQSDMAEAALLATPEMMKAGIVLFATIPILVVYPFLQKYFVKGAMLGSLKE